MSDEAGTICAFQSPVFSRLNGSHFQRGAIGSEASLVFTLDGQVAVLPLAAMASAFRIQPGSPDEGMIDLVSRALAFRHVIRLGDAIPTEVIDGRASWKPLPRCELSVAAHLKLCVLRWQGGEDELGPLNSAMLTTSDEKTRAVVQRLLRQAAEAAGLGAEPGTLLRRLDELSAELAYVQSLREGFLGDLLAAGRSVRAASKGSMSLASKREMVFQVLTLINAEASRVEAILGEADITEENIEPVLRDPVQARETFRSARDRAYGISLSWEEPLRSWAEAVEKAEDTGPALFRLYRFVARHHIESQ